LEYTAEDMLELITLLWQDNRPTKKPEAIEKLVRRYVNSRIGALWKANQLLQHIEHTWDKVSKDDSDRTNNATERLIGLNYAQHGQAHKIRAKTMRGIKSIPKALNHSYPSEHLRGEDGVCDLWKVI